METRKGRGDGRHGAAGGASLLRLGLLWHGRLLREGVFEPRGPVTLGEDAGCTFVVPSPAAGPGWPLFQPGPGGTWAARWTEDLRGQAVLDGVAVSLGDAARRSRGTGSILGPADWGVLDFGEVQVFFQLVERRLPVGRRRVLDLDGGFIAANVGIGFALLALVVGSQLLAGDAVGTERRPEAVRELQVVRNVVTPEVRVPDVAAIDEEEGAKRAGGEEGVFGAPDLDRSLATKLPLRDGRRVDRVKARDVGLAGALTGNRTRALGEVLSPDVESWDNRMQVAMAGSGSEYALGWGTNGMSFRGTGPGGGGDGPGALWAVGSRDALKVGPGHGVRSALGPKNVRKVGTVGVPDGTVSAYCRKDDLQRVVRGLTAAIRACYERQLMVQEGLGGKVTLRWTIDGDGGVESMVVAESTIGSSAVERCVADTVRRSRFVKPEGGVCVVAWPFVFRAD